VCDARRRSWKLYLPKSPAAARVSRRQARGLSHMASTSQNQRVAGSFQRAPAPTYVVVHRLGNSIRPPRRRTRRAATGWEAYRTLHRPHRISNLREFPERVQSTLPSVGDRISTTIYCDQPTTRPLDLGVEITKNHSFRQTARPLRSSYRRSRVLPADEPVPEVGVNLPRRKLFDFLGALVAESPFIPATG
jgi:hypothetical protein